MAAGAIRFAPMKTLATICLPLLALALSLAGARPAPAQESEGEPAPPPLTLAAVEVEPAAPTADTLCRLRVKIANAGDKPASSLAFQVSVAGHTLPVYANQLFMQALPPGETTEVRLYNFWVSETGRPAPAGDKLQVEVTLTEARWLKISTDEEGVEVWQPLEAVPGLPVSSSVTLPLKGAKPAPPAEGEAGKEGR